MDREPHPATAGDDKIPDGRRHTQGKGLAQVLGGVDPHDPGIDRSPELSVWLAASLMRSELRFGR